MDFTMQTNNCSMNSNSNMALQNYNEFNNSSYHQNSSYQYYNNSNNDSYKSYDNFNAYYDANKNYYFNNDNNDYNFNYTATSKNNEYEQRYQNTNNYYNNSLNEWSGIVNDTSVPAAAAVKNSSPMNNSHLKSQVSFNDTNMLNSSATQNCYVGYNMPQHYDEYSYDLASTTTNSISTPSNSKTIPELASTNTSCDLISAGTNDYSNWDYNSNNNNNNQIYPSIENKSQIAVMNDNTKLAELGSFNYNYTDNTTKTNVYNFDQNISPVNETYQFGYNNLQPTDQYKISNDKKFYHSNFNKSANKDDLGKGFSGRIFFIAFYF